MRKIKFEDITGGRTVAEVVQDIADELNLKYHNNSIYYLDEVDYIKKWKTINTITGNWVPTLSSQFNRNFEVFLINRVFKKMYSVSNTKQPRGKWIYASDFDDVIANLEMNPAIIKDGIFFQNGWISYQQRTWIEYDWHFKFQFSLEVKEFDFEYTDPPKLTPKVEHLLKNVMVKKWKETSGERNNWTNLEKFLISESFHMSNVSCGITRFIIGDSNCGKSKYIQLLSAVSNSIVVSNDIWSSSRDLYKMGRAVDYNSWVCNEVMQHFSPKIISDYKGFNESGGKAVARKMKQEPNEYPVIWSITMTGNQVPLLPLEIKEIKNRTIFTICEKPKNIDGYKNKANWYRGSKWMDYEDIVSYGNLLAHAFLKFIQDNEEPLCSKLFTTYQDDKAKTMISFDSDLAHWVDENWEHYINKSHNSDVLEQRKKLYKGEWKETPQTLTKKITSIPFIEYKPIWNGDSTVRGFVINKDKFYLHHLNFTQHNNESEYPYINILKWVKNGK